MGARSRGQWRLLDTGLRGAAENMALNRALLESHQQGFIAHTLRFLRFRPSALIGYHQSVEQELREDYCREHGIAVQRRITGGGAIYFDEGQLGWELYLDRRAVDSADMQSITRRICEAAAGGISALGLDARFRPRNDIEVNGRKISGTGGVFEGSSFLFQGTLLLDFDVEHMLRVLRIPAEKLSDKAIESARERVTDLREQLGGAPELDEVKRRLAAAFATAFNVEFESAEQLNEHEQCRYDQALAEMSSPEWIYELRRPATDAPILGGLYRAAGGLIRATVAFDRRRDLVKQVWLTGDFFVQPRRAILDLEAVLKDTPRTQLHARIETFFAEREVDLLMLEPNDFFQALVNAIESGV